MANTVNHKALAIAATALVMVILVSVSEAAPFFTDNTPSVNLPRVELPTIELPTIELPEFSLPEIDPATSIENGGRAIARTTDGVVVLLNNGYYALVRTSTGLVESVLSIPEMLMRMARSIPFFG